jgi:hypothetical protein
VSLVPRSRHHGYYGAGSETTGMKWVWFHAPSIRASPHWCAARTENGTWSFHGFSATGQAGNVEFPSRPHDVTVTFNLPVESSPPQDQHKTTTPPSSCRDETLLAQQDRLLARLEAQKWLQNHYCCAALLTCPNNKDVSANIQMINLSCFLSTPGENMSKIEQVLIQKVWNLDDA